MKRRTKPHLWPEVAWYSQLPRSHSRLGWRAQNVVGDGGRPFHCASAVEQTACPREDEAGSLRSQGISVPDASAVGARLCDLGAAYNLHSLKHEGLLALFQRRLDFVHDALKRRLY